MRFLWILCVFALFGLPLAARAESLRCGGRLVGPGDSRLELKRYCGAPNHRYVRPVLRANGFERPTTILRDSEGSVTTVPQIRRVRYLRELVETWTYRGDKGTLGRVVTLRRGKVESVDTLGTLGVVEDPGCARALHGTGSRLGTVFLSCGEPDDTAVWEEERELQVSGLIKRRLIVYQRWTYHPGKGRFLRVLDFENGRLVRVRTGGRAP